MFNRRPSFTWLWAWLAVAALAWPARVAGSFDGLPLETVPKAIVIGVVFPALLWFHSRFLRTRVARGVVVALLACKAVLAMTVVPDGWCVRFVPGRPLVKDARGVAPHSWDVRADWRADDPVCSAVMRRPYKGLGEFPAWFFNLPPPNDSWPEPVDRPPDARTAMSVAGFLHATHPGVLRIEMTKPMSATVSVDAVPVGESVDVSAGTHRVRIDAVLTEDVWRLVPTWNGASVWSSVTATLQRPSTLDVLLRPAGGWLITALVALLIGSWTASFVMRIGSWSVLAWTLGASTCLGLLAATRHLDAARWLVAALAAAALVPVPPRLRNVFGAFALIGIPWLTLIVVANAGYIGRFSWYSSGDDFWMYQRWGYRIVMQGYWLEGGTKEFYFQPFYRWVSGLLHLVFGDSSAGEFFWDGSCLLATALFAFHVTKTSAGFRWAVIAATMTLSIVALGAPWGLIGRGLSEITSAGFLYVAAFLALRSRRASLGFAVGAGMLASLAFYTRLNNLPMAAAVAVCALSTRAPIRRLLQPSAWPRIVAWRTLLTVPAVLAMGLAFFAWRNWYYSGVFSVFFGTQRNIVALWQPGRSIGEVLGRAFESAFMVLSVHDPPVLDWKAMPVLVGACVAPLAVLGVPRLKDVPAVPVLFFLAGISAAFVARGWTYQGRFSVHVIGVTCALAICAIERLMRPRRTYNPPVAILNWPAMLKK